MDIFLYDDGEVGIFGDGIDIRYELLDYMSYEELKSKVLLDLSSFLERLKS